ncbi:MAG: UDP-N-acetylmuramoyl-L-alanine--D-glutamate ligase [Anaerolineales bacterium]|jgi:UDP-N-acetylmuramoylalanine--D-glutamate ligase
MEYSRMRVVILGLARQGTALSRYLAARGAQVVASDIKPAEALGDRLEALRGLDLEFVLGGHPLQLLDGADLLFLSGGVPGDLPIVLEARRRGIPISNDSQVFLEACPARTIGITGSAGKTTTTALVAEIGRASAAFAKPGAVWMGGNIGNPLIAELERIRPEDLVVMELSSFQLEWMTRSPNIAAVLNLTPNHLDRHGTMAAYREAKARILQAQGRKDWAVFGWDSPEARGLLERAQGRSAFFGLDPLAAREWIDGCFLDEGWIVLRRARQDVRVLKSQEIRLRGRHNLANVVAACILASLAGIAAQEMGDAIRRFPGVPHRLEFVGRIQGVDWYNDSIATAPERAIAAMESFPEPLVLLAGGRDKKLPWEEWARRVRTRVDHLVLFGEAAALIESALSSIPNTGRPMTVSRCAGLEEAVRAAAKVARPGSVVLLAPGGTSFDEFRDFEERGERFRDWVMQLRREVGE